ncbi:amino acid transporter [Shewanella oneidensis MR-1]|uniref:L-arginine efflux tranporter ArgO n=1 Tax=Shewanella oneidensis (strain ATCC 700550 / JCM 31522 / CIP 106686 / LMG 19005 / NCIMB 14063 / MR-1) TaxID=211586 RepID=Q8ED97_SHEON|nr:LysE/ArgO family amino acid transporter [Shewanella oneidensis]AAN55881.1 L-arginine efflux tranporter ArgO [Shewanella oneidensis MR-1]MDX5999679.1 LysE/ArgO family amino acid transporter [Shewanella oneidensis]MEE2029761.1 Arginine exporter protein ArgO [Shewanella oneidensis]QKG97336.1 amino acid transporter [Shewanella oneidensis MR-1]
MQTAFIQGMGIGGSLIIAVGAQNAFVLKQGIKRAYPLPIALLCSIIDALMITAGVAGLGHIIETFPTIKHVASFGGAAFLIWYGANALKASFVTKGMEMDHAQNADTLRKAILTTLGISLLNPHLYLDTVVLLGSISTQFEDAHRPWFGAGAVLASFIWFFSLSFGARLLAPIFSRPAAWRYLDRFIWLTMWSIAAAIIWPYLAAI